MSDGTSARLALPLLAAGQAQKEMTVNEALTLLDITVQATAVSGGLDTPPETPNAGECWVVGEAPVGDWSGKADMLAGWTAEGWRFVAPIRGMALWVAAAGETWRYGADGWVAGDLVGRRLVIEDRQVVGPQLEPIAAPEGGDVSDSEARATLGAVLDALRTHGLIAV